jgi:hypothetical protein
MTNAIRCHTLALNKTHGNICRKECHYTQNKKEGGLSVQLRMGPWGEWVSSPNSIRRMLIVIHMDQGVHRLTKWHATRVGLSS